MRNLLISFGLLLSACATMGGGTKSSGAFPGKEAVEKRKLEIVDAHKVANGCLKGEGIKGGFFAITADPSGKLSAQQIKWDGPPAVAQCILDAANKATITPAQGLPVAATWQFWAPGAEPPPQQLPDGIEGKIGGLQEVIHAEVMSCGSRFLGDGFYAQTSVMVFVTPEGKAYAPTVMSSNANDTSFDGCVLDAVAKAKYPPFDIVNPAPLTMTFTIGQSHH